MKKKDLLMIVVIALTALAILGYALSQRKAAPAPSATTAPAPTASLTPAPTPKATLAPEGAAQVTPGSVPAQGTVAPAEPAAQASPTPRPTLYPAESYLRVTTATQVFEPIPLLDDGQLKLTQGEGVENVIHVGKNSVSMESSTCENQDCVQQGEVTLENRDTRILYNMVICLPNQVSLELLTPEEAQTAWEEIYGAQ